MAHYHLYNQAAAIAMTVIAKRTALMLKNDSSIVASNLLLLFLSLFR